MPDQDQPAEKPARVAATSGPTAAQDAAWNATQTDWEQRRAEQEAEYGVWVATQRIDINGVPAFLAGHAVPQAHVDKYGLNHRAGDEDKPLVVKRESKAGTELLESIAAAARGD